MDVFVVGSILVVLAGVFSFINARFLRLPTMIGVMLLSLIASLLLLALGTVAGGFREHVTALLHEIHFDKAVLHGMLAFLLFAGALHLDLNEMLWEKLPITALSFAATFLSTVAVGWGMFLLLRLIGTPLPVISCFVFGALVSPTDPIAVLGILKSAKAPKALEIQMVGESLFNDGIGVVIFLTILEIAGGGRAPTVANVSLLLLQEIGGGVGIGLATGYLTYILIKQVDQYQVEVLLTLGLAMGGYALADALHVSAPIAIVVAGLLIGNHGRRFVMSDKTREHLDSFWELIDEIMNVLLFMLVGLQMLVMPFSRYYILVGTAAIFVALLSRWASVAGVISLIRLRQPVLTGTIRVLTWGGLRGGLSLAMALSLPPSQERDIILAATYGVVIFSVLVQGLTIGKLVQKVCVKP